MESDSGGYEDSDRNDEDYYGGEEIEESTQELGALAYRGTAARVPDQKENNLTIAKKDYSLADVILHLFLCKRTPERRQGNLEKIETQILHAFTTSLKSAAAEGSFICELYCILATFEKWEQVQPKPSNFTSDEIIEKLQTALTNLEDGCTLPIYVRNQNCTVLFRKVVNEDGVQVVTFRSALSGEMVMSSVKEPCMEFPETVETIQNTELLGSTIFAKQIYELTEGSVDISLGMMRDSRDVPSPFLVSDWIVGLLSPRQRKESEEAALSRIKFSKKIRDQITFSAACSSSLPFRRSGMYMSIKVTLQLQLFQLFGSTGPQLVLVYKMIMLRFLTDVAKRFCDENDYSKSKIDMDTGSQILAKLGRRVRKLENQFLTVSFKDSEEHIFKGMLESCYAYTHLIVERLHKLLYSRWERISNFKLNSLPVGKSHEKKKPIYKEEDLHHKLTNLDDFIDKLQISKQEVNTSNLSKGFSDLKEIKRYRTSSSIIAASSSNPSRTFLYDVENYIKYNYASDIEKPDTLRVAEITRKYLGAARKVYENDPVQMSQMLLVALKSMEISDRKVTGKYPLLLEYRTDVNTTLFEHLLLPHKKDMLILEDLVDYFDKRNSAAYTIFNTDVNTDSFSVRYAERSPAMRNFRKKILDKIEREIAKKHAEVHNSKQICLDLQQKIEEAGGCKCEYETKRWRDICGEWHSNRKKTFQCRRCDLEPQLAAYRTLVNVYERPLPPKEEYQWAIVFELTAPEDFAIWRDYLAFLKYEILGEKCFNEDSRKDWLDYSGLSEHITSCRTQMTLGSDSGPGSNTYQYRVRNPDALINTKEDYTAYNGMGCSYRYKLQGKPIECLAKTCTFLLSLTENSAPYENLQSNIETWTHTENSVIASQYQCHQKLTLREYLAFGSLRAGHRIQLRNLYEAIFSEALSLDQEPVLALILQTVWQVGPRSSSKQRESHMDFEDVNFAAGFLEMLNELVQRNKVNYSKALILFNAVVLTCRISELNNSLQNKCYTKLKEWRSITAKWTTQIQTELDRPSVSSEVEAAFKKCLLEVTLCSIYSYNVVDKSHINNVIRDEEDITQWLTSLYHLGQLENTKISEFLRNVVNFAKLIPVRLGILDGVINHDLLDSSVLDYISKKWNKANELQFVEMVQSGSAVCVEYKDASGTEPNYKVAIDFFSGEFLVNGVPPSTLPAKIRYSPVFLEYFKNCGTFRVQRSAENVFRTEATYYDRHYEFCENVMLSDTNNSETDIMIKEVWNGYPTLTLLDPGIFSGNISDFFLDGYTHWLDDQNRIVYFRPESAKTNEKRPYDYMLKQVNIEQERVWTFENVQNGEYIFSIQSNGFKNITSVLGPIEIDKYINVTTNKTEKKTMARAYRYNLKFEVKGSNIFESVEYPDYTISSLGLKTLGTLVGLRNGIILQNKKKQQLLIVPHSEIGVKHGKGHPIVLISLEKLEEPACFVYEIDPILKRLKPHNSKAAWLYLAALHAVTSSPLPDPFTEVTGTEMAVRILQSASIWSCSPYDKESLSILKYIYGLSPKRLYYGKSSPDSVGERGSMEVIEWPSGLHSMAAYDGFAIIVSSLFGESQQLAVLHTENVDKTEFDKSSEILRIRAYTRYLSTYNPAVYVKESQHFTEFQTNLLKGYKPSHFPAWRVSADGFNNDNLVIMANSCFAQSVSDLIGKNILRKNCLESFLVTDETLNLPIPEAYFHGTDSLQKLLRVNFRYNWLKFYNMAIGFHKSKEMKNQFMTILCALAYQREPMEQIANLHCIALHSTSFPPAPVFERREINCKPTSNFCDTTTIKNIILNNAFAFTELSEPTAPMWCYEKSEEYEPALEKYERDLKLYKKEKAAYEMKIQNACNLATSVISAAWPRDEIQSKEDVGKQLSTNNIKASPTIDLINECLSTWYRNYKLKLFIEDVQNKLNEIYDKLVSVKANANYSELETYQGKIDFLPSGTIELDIESLLDISLAAYEGEAEHIYSTAGYTEEETGEVDKENYMNALVAKRKRYQNKITSYMKNIKAMLTSNIPRRILCKAGISPRTAPLNILQLLSKPSNESQSVIASYAGALGVLWTNLRRIERCLRLEDFSAVQREMKNTGHLNWIPKEHPDWLLLELELNITIRRVQVDVAQQMIAMPTGQNGVTQLNMGEGKTSVIVPMVCSTLALKNTKLCRVTVLSSMFKMNLTSLAFSIGGLLGRRVYIMPCKRDMLFDEKLVERMQNTYQSCLESQGVLLTLPEYRLSFRLLAYDKILRDEIALGMKMMNVENWLRHYARDILDESDELFNVKYQLVYTVGDQKLIDGGDVRWTLCQKILGLVHAVGKAFEENEVEMNENYQKSNPHEFSTIRLLSSGCVDKFMEMLADKLPEEITVSNSAEKQLVKNFLLSHQTSLEDHIKIMREIFKDDPETLQKIILMSGYFRRGVLGLALMKRWRVEYGIHPKQFRRMAVPYRAKDVAAEKTEFGHSDLAIILTHLSYYYSGLDDKQMQEAFDVLKAKQSSISIYSTWIGKMLDEHSDKIPKSYDCLNMTDLQQKAELFGALRKHKMVIDFWLSNCVFPRESRQFPGKLVMTAWDLCYERQRFAVTGFSGTNDSKTLLPLMITQQDLPQLEETNQNMNKTLLLPENNGHKAMPMAVTCAHILKEMRNDNLTVLIDAGALMLELDNQQIACLWLKENSDIEAVVYFSKDDELLVMCRDDSGQRTPFDVSPYQSRLEKCGVFLDDQHTRGTDLKFPQGIRACVTVGTRMKRDKLIQACMRMRKLGNGHTVTFYLSHEAHNNINADGDENEICTQAVLNWVTENTRKSNEDGLLYWAHAGRNYAQRLAAEDNFHFPHHGSPSQVTYGESEDAGKSKILASQCVDDEVVSLMDMYSQYTQIDLLVNLIPKWFEHTKRKLQKKHPGENIPAEVLLRFDEICAKIKERCLLLAPEKTHVSGLSMMEEEQEKELEREKEVELEEEKIIERPRQAAAAKPYAHPNVKRYILNGGHVPLEGGGIVRLCDTFSTTSFWNEVQPNCWRGNVYATVDFVSVIQNAVASHHKTDAHLRPIKYLVSFQEEGGMQLLVLSPFEVNEWMPYFNSGQVKCTLHLFSTRRRERQDVLVNKPQLQLPFSGMESDIVSESSMEMASLLLASGNLYFVSMEEQKAFTRFVGLALEPWSDWEQQVADKEGITKTGFVLPEHRVEKGGFENDPVPLIKKILMCRHSEVNEVVHLIRLLKDKRYIDLP